MKKWLVVLILMVLGAGAVRKFWDETDFSLGLVSPKQIALVSISPQRGMINMLKIGAEVEVWLPGGMGWYQSSKIDKIWDGEEKKKIIEKMFYYNFGFFPERLLKIDEVDKWRSLFLGKFMGVIPWLNYLVNQENWLYKVENINRSLLAEKENLKEILVRDFADSSLGGGEIRVSVVNESGENGFGNFLADRLEWMGYRVMTVESGVKKDGCEVVAGSKVLKSVEINAQKLANLFGCSQVSNNWLLENEIWIYAGEKLASMIKYSSYVRSF